jgi:hypothetical protein
MRGSVLGAGYPGGALRWNANFTHRIDYIGQSYPEFDVATGQRCRYLGGADGGRGRGLLQFAFKRALRTLGAA